MPNPIMTSKRKQSETSITKLLEEFSQLPPEMQFHIWSFFSKKELLELRLINRDFHKDITEELAQSYDKKYLTEKTNQSNGKGKEPDVASTITNNPSIGNPLELNTPAATLAKKVFHTSIKPFMYKEELIDNNNCIAVLNKIYSNYSEKENSAPPYPLIHKFRNHPDFLAVVIYKLKKHLPYVGFSDNCRSLTEKLISILLEQNNTEDVLSLLKTIKSMVNVSIDPQHFKNALEFITQIESRLLETRIIPKATKLGPYLWEIGELSNSIILNMEQQVLFFFLKKQFSKNDINTIKYFFTKISQNNKNREYCYYLQCIIDEHDLNDRTMKPLIKLALNIFNDKRIPGPEGSNKQQMVEVVIKALLVDDEYGFNKNSLLADYFADTEAPIFVAEKLIALGARLESKKQVISNFPTDGKTSTLPNSLLSIAILSGDVRKTKLALATPDKKFQSDLDKFKKAYRKAPYLARNKKQNPWSLKLKHIIEAYESKQFFDRAISELSSGKKSTFFRTRQSPKRLLELSMEKDKNVCRLLIQKTQSELQGDKLLRFNQLPTVSQLAKQQQPVASTSGLKRSK